jgi:sugar phosphate isomerase/epimerase
MVKLTLKRSSKLSQYDFKGWAVMEWECCIKNQEDGAREGAEFIKIL